MNEKLKFNGPAWKKISAEAQSLLKEILERNITKRKTAAEVL